MVLWLPCVMVRPLDLLGLDDQNKHGNPLSPCKQSLLYSSSVRRRRRRKRGSAWITSNLWGHCSPNCWTRQILFPLLKLFFFGLSIPSLICRWSKLTVIRPVSKAMSYYLITCRACSTKILLDSCIKKAY